MPEPPVPDLYAVLNAADEVWGTPSQDPGAAEAELAEAEECGDCPPYRIVRFAAREGGADAD